MTTDTPPAASDDRPPAGVLADPRLRWLLWAALALVAFGLWAFVLRGADGPADPTLGGPPAVLGAPGDPERVPLEGFDEVAIKVDPGDGRGLLSWCLLAAMSSDQRSQGLMGVTDLQGYSGMAFVYAEDSQNGFYMRNTPMPLSIAWIAEDGSVVSTADMAPCEDRADCQTYPSFGVYRLAIEVPQGGLDSLGIVPGSRTDLVGACGPRSSSG